MDSLLSVPTLMLVLMLTLAAVAGAFISWLVNRKAYLHKANESQALREKLIQLETLRE